jgi:formylglycine-generating enzyme required for sulfatase activity
MHGNVWEWCQDWFANSYDGADQVDPQGADSGTDRSIRGGGWNSKAETNANSSRSAQRDGCPPAACASYIGFRIVVEAE